MLLHRLALFVVVKVFGVETGLIEPGKRGCEDGKEGKKGVCGCMNSG